MEKYSQRKFGSEKIKKNRLTLDALSAEVPKFGKTASGMHLLEQDNAICAETAVTDSQVCK